MKKKKYNKSLTDKLGGEGLRSLGTGLTGLSGDTERLRRRGGGDLDLDLDLEAERDRERCECLRGGVGDLDLERLRDLMEKNADETKLKLEL
jgi:hypothetical protein